MRARGIRRLLGAAVVTSVLAGCGEQEGVETPEPFLKQPTAEIGGPTSPISGSSYEPLIRSRAVLSSEADALIVGHVLLQDPAAAESVELQLRIGNRPAAEAQTAIIESGADTAVIITCLCRPTRQTGEVTLEARSESPAPVAARGISTIENVRAEPSSSADGLPEPLIAAAVERPGEIDLGQSPIIETSLAEQPEGTPLVLLGVAGTNERGTDLEAIQIDAAIGTDRVAPRGTFAVPGKLVSGFTGETTTGDDTVSLVAGTAAGGSVLTQTALFACACTLIAR